MQLDNKTIGINLVLEEIEGIKILNAQYQKELKDAEAGTGLCSGMSKNAREVVAKTLKKHISDNEKSIQEMLMYISEIENE